VNKLESLLRKAGRELADWQVCRLFKVPEEMQQTPCDFFGYTPAGRAIMIEAKMVSRPRLPLGQAPGLSVHQWNALREAHRANCLALIAWQRGGTIAVFDVDMAIVLSTGMRSIPWQKIQERFLHPVSDSRVAVTMLEPYLCVGRS
jgi:hypothetical protein